MTLLVTLRYHLLLQLDGAAIGALLFPALIATAVSASGELLPLAELLFVLPAPMLMASLLSREWEGGTADVLLARPVRRVELILSRLLAGFLITLLAILLGWGCLMLRGLSLPLGQALAITTPGSLALGLLGLAVATASQNSVAGYLVPMAWWLLDWFTGGRVTGKLYLFNGLTPDKWWLVGFAALSLITTTELLVKRTE